MAASARSYLSVPAGNDRMIARALASDADAVLLDLEDAVAPPHKEAARGHVIRAVQEADWRGRPRAFRMNGIDTPYFYRDLIEIVEAAGAQLDMVIVPKVERPEDVTVVDALLAGIERRTELGIGRIALQVQIESARGLLNVDRVAESCRRVRALIYGPGDFAASMGMPMTSIGAMDEWDAAYPGHRFHYAMSRIVVAARAVGLEAIDGPLADFRNLEALESSCKIARGLGFDGKWCIHPDQILPVNRVFSPTDAEVAWAQRVVKTYAKASGAMSVDGRMIDEASVKLAERTLSRVYS